MTKFWWKNVKKTLFSICYEEFIFITFDAQEESYVYKNDYKNAFMLLIKKICQKNVTDIWTKI